MTSKPFTGPRPGHRVTVLFLIDRKSTRLNSSHGYISYAVFCLKKKKKKKKKLTTKQHKKHIISTHNSHYTHSKITYLQLKLKHDTTITTTRQIRESMQLYIYCY